MLRKYLLFLMFFCSIITFGCLEEDITKDDYDREQNLNKILMCPACPGESIDQSQNPLASNMREIVKQKVKEGLTDDEIKQYFVDRYGVRVLLEPPVRSNTLVLWIVPPISICILAIILITIMKMKRRVSDNIDIGDSSIE